MLISKASGARLGVVAMPLAARLEVSDVVRTAFRHGFLVVQVEIVGRAAHGALPSETAHQVAAVARRQSPPHLGSVRRGHISRISHSHLLPLGFLLLASCFFDS